MLSGARAIEALLEILYLDVLCGEVVGVGCRKVLPDFG